MATPVTAIVHHHHKSSNPPQQLSDGDMLMLPKFKKNQRNIDITDHSWCCARPDDPQPPPVDIGGKAKFSSDIPGNPHGLVACAAVSMGTREHMEDRHRIHYAGDGVFRGFFGVFDGHGGEETAHYTSKNLHQIIIDTYQHTHERGHIHETKTGEEKRISTDPDGGRRLSLDKKAESTQSKYKTNSPDFKHILEASFDELEKACLKLSTEVGCRDGTTACTITIANDTIYCANTGDSRAVLCRGGQAVPLSSDHKPHNTDEKQRIMNAGGEVHCVMADRAAFCCFSAKQIPQGAERLWPGGFSVSRAIGDIDYKDLRRKKCKVVNVLIHRPDVTVTTISPEDQFIIIATDGLWDVVTNSAACELVTKEIQKAKKKDRHWIPQEAAKKLADKAYSLGSEDNITVVVVVFTNQTS